MTAPSEQTGERPDAGDEPDEPCPAGTDDRSDDPGDQDAEEPEELLYADAPLPSDDELRAAMDWAFEVEEVPAGLLDRFAAHARMVLEGNRSMNLSSLVAPREVAAQHYLDSWRTTQFLAIFGRTVLDLATGAGFPAVPMALAEPDTKFLAVDARRSRVDFLTQCADELELRNLEAIHAKGEEFLLQRKVDIVVVRGLSSVRENVRLLRKARQGMHDLVMLKGKSWSRELRAAEREAERLGFRFDTVWEHELPGEQGQRAILIYRAPGGAGR